jgi:TRAP transporter 4TM/12TM fusion protein
MAEAFVIERTLSRWLRVLVLVLAFIFAFYEIFVVMGLNFALYTILKNLGFDVKALLYAPDIQQSMAFLLGLLLLTAYMLYPARRRGASISKVPIYDYLLGLTAFLSMLYLVIIFPRIVQLGYVEATIINVLVPVVAILLLLEASRRVLGIALPLITLAVMLLGLAYEGFNIRRFVNHMFYAREGIFAIPLYVMVSYVYAFVLFGSILEKIGVGEYITKFVMSVVGHRWGGPAKTAVVASALMGTVSGSSVANVLTTGVFTIPLMKKAGYPPEVAGAVEPAASTGGQLMPPVMGAAAFVMAQFLGRPYRDIMIAAAIPAILYFTSVYVFIDRVTKKLNIRPLPRDALPRFREMIPGIYLLSPIPIITWLLLAGLEPQYSAIAAIATAIISAWIYQRNLSTAVKLVASTAIILLGALGYFLGLPLSTSMFFAGALSIIIAIVIGILIKGLKEFGNAIINAIESSFKSSAVVFFAASCAGLIQGVLTMTGWATDIGYRLVDLSGGNVFILMFTAMSISLILGMGVPTTANYIITSTIVGTPMARALASITDIDLELAKLVAHMFVFYFGIMADLTPPVALASYAGSMLAKSYFWKTAWNATKFALAGYLVPYIFALNPVLLILPALIMPPTVATYKMVIGIASSILSILLLSAGIVGWHYTHIGLAQRALLIVLGVAALTQNEFIVIASLIIYIALYLYNRSKAIRVQQDIQKR